jgi:two-component sensor histidine kinase
MGDGSVPDGAASQAETQRRFLRAFCWLAIVGGVIAMGASRLVLGESPYVRSPATGAMLLPIYGPVVWALVGSRHEYHHRHAMGVLLGVEVTLIVLLATLQPTSAAIGLLFYLTLSTLLAGFLLPPWTVWATAVFNTAAIASLVVATREDPLADLASMNAARAFVAQLVTATAVWFFATRAARLIRHQQRRIEEKQVLLQEVHHRVKNNLQVISSLLGLQAGRTDSDEVRTAIDQTKRRILAMAAAHEAVYRGTDLARVSLPDYLQDVVHYTEQAVSNPNVKVRLDVAPIHMAMERAIPVGLLLGELVMNALKHAFPDGGPGTVEVTLTREDDHLRLRVQDDGSGLPAGLLEQSDSLGFTLVRALADQVEGELSVEGMAGTRVELSLPGGGVTQ